MLDVSYSVSLGRVPIRRSAKEPPGKTTTTEFAAVFAGPKTRNAHSTSRTPGGSSSGSGASVGDFQVPIAIGSQTMGSIIRPASFNGTYGFKPTWNAITREGQKFSALTFDTIGFFTRSVDDIEALMDLFAVQDDEESKFTDVKGSHIAVCKTIQWSQAGQGTVHALEKAVELLKAHGAQVEEVSLGSDFDRVVEWHGKLGQTEGGITFLPEYVASKQDLDDRLAGWVENRENISHRDELEAYDGLSALRPKFDALASRFDAILTPSVVDEAPEGLNNTGSPIFASTWTVRHLRTRQNMTDDSRPCTHPSSTCRVFGVRTTCRLDCPLSHLASEIVTCSRLAKQLVAFLQQRVDGLEDHQKSINFVHLITRFNARTEKSPSFYR